MTKAFIFSFNKDVSIPNEGVQKQKLFVLFFPYKDLQNDKTDIQIQLRSYFHKNLCEPCAFFVFFVVKNKLYSKHNSIIFAA